MTPDVIRQRLHRAIAALVATAAIGTRTVICIEDLHWADASSIELLADIVAKGLLPGVALVVTSRTDASRVAPWLDAVRRSGEERAIELDPLDADAVAAVLARTLVTPNPQSWLRDALLERSEGNPFYLASFLRSLVDDGSAIFEDGRIFLQREPAELRLPGLATRRGRRAYRPARRRCQGGSATGLDHWSPFPHRSVGSARRRERRSPRRRRCLGRYSNGS